MTNTNRPLFSIVTVVYNDATNLEKTIQSIISQNFRNYEYIIIDGGSTDATLQVIKKYQKYINYWSSEPDKGIYDAMNKGIAVADGDYLNFLNAGDSFRENQSLQIFADEVSGHFTLDVLYSKSARVGFGYEIFQGGPINEKRLHFGMPFCHQTVFFHSELFSKYGNFDTKYRYAADYAWMLNYLHTKGNLNETKYLSKVLINYLDGGASFDKFKDTICEQELIALRFVDSSNYISLRLYYWIQRVKSQVLLLLDRSPLLNYYRRVKSSLIKYKEVKQSRC
ncbi:MAG: glycosyltransferase family 2 protein [Bacteroidota bacterium]